ncbi:MAG: hypothetical protein LWX56_07960 [Ignavibacteria bacterium]|nr:hypothetical protein [Ignavibacteria bacterium]
MLDNPNTNSDPDGKKVINKDRNGNGYVFCNSKIVTAVQKFNEAICRLTNMKSDDFKLQISGGDRYKDANGAIRSKSNNSIVSNSVKDSPHLQSNGGRGVDIIYPSNVPLNVLEKAAEMAGLTKNVWVYNDNHFHLGLANSNENMPEPGADMNYRPTDADFNNVNSTVSRQSQGADTDPEENPADHHNAPKSNSNETERSLFAEFWYKFFHLFELGKKNGQRK